MSQPTRALVRSVAPSFADALVQQAPGAPIDVALAQRQHAAYVAALRGLGLTVRELPAEAAYPDGCFVEDMAVVAVGRALIARSGAPSRRGEAPSVAAALAGAGLEVTEMAAPATLDGGDVLRVGRTLLVGRSERTNAAGVEALRGAFEPLGFAVRAVAVPAALHLKCYLSSPRPGLLLAARGRVAPAWLEGLGEVAWLPEEEAYAANVVGVGERVLVAAGHPQTQAALGSLGLEPVPLEVSEIAKADGSLTCLSVLY